MGPRVAPAWRNFLETRPGIRQSGSPLVENFPWVPKQLWALQRFDSTFRSVFGFELETRHSTFLVLHAAQLILFVTLTTSSYRPLPSPSSSASIMWGCIVHVISRLFGITSSQRAVTSGESSEWEEALSLSLFLLHVCVCVCAPTTVGTQLRNKKHISPALCAPLIVLLVLLLWRTHGVRPPVRWSVHTHTQHTQHTVQFISI